MSLLACGISHHTAPLDLREKMVFPTEAMSQPLLDLIEDTQVSEAAILSTCNRTELYCTQADPKRVIDWLHRRRQLPKQTLESCFYVHQDKAAVQHILRVASGLDSLVLGEPQILGQLKKAFALAEIAGTLGKYLQRLSQYVFAVSKHVRTTTALGRHSLSIASTAVDLAKHIFADMTNITVLLIGAGEMIELMARHLQTAGITKFLIANRHLARAETLAKTVQAKNFVLEAIPDYLPMADMVVAATGSVLPILGKGAVERALKTRKHRPMFMVDLAVPRNIEPEINYLDDVYLYTLEDVQTIITQHLQNRREASQQAETLIAVQAERYMHELKILDAAPVVRAYRQQTECLRDQELAKALQLLKKGVSAEESLKYLARALTNKLLHTPSVQIKEAVYEGQTETLKWACKILGIQCPV